MPFRRRPFCRRRCRVCRRNHSLGRSLAPCAPSRAAVARPSLAAARCLPPSVVCMALGVACARRCRLRLSPPFSARRDSAPSAFALALLHGRSNYTWSLDAEEEQLLCIASQRVPFQLALNGEIKQEWDGRYPCRFIFPEPAEPAPLAAELALPLIGTLHMPMASSASSPGFPALGHAASTPQTYSSVAESASCALVAACGSGSAADAAASSSATDAASSISAAGGGAMGGGGATGGGGAAARPLSILAPSSNHQHSSTHPAKPSNQAGTKDARGAVAAARRMEAEKRLVHRATKDRGQDRILVEVSGGTDMKVGLKLTRALAQPDTIEIMAKFEAQGGGDSENVISEFDPTRSLGSSWTGVKTTGPIKLVDCQFASKPYGFGAAPKSANFSKKMLGEMKDIFYGEVERRCVVQIIVHLEPEVEVLAEPGVGVVADASWLDSD